MSSNQTKQWAGQLLAGVLACGLVGHSQAQAQAPQARVIVKLKAGASVLKSSVVQAQSASGAEAALGAQAMQRLGQRRGLVLADGRMLGGRLHVAQASGLRSQDLAALLARDSDVEYAVPDQWRQVMAVPTDPLYAASISNNYVRAGQWYLRPPSSEARAAINAEPAWDMATGAGVVVAVLDTGVRFDHPDLAGQLHTGYNFITEGLRGGNAGRGTDASDMGDWLTGAEILANPDVYEDCAAKPASSWHGTKVSGVVAALSNNGQGMASLAWDAKVLPVRVLGKCGGWDSDIIAGMRWAAGLPVTGVAPAAQPARVINMSLGGDTACTPAYSQVVAEINALGAVVVASAGNSAGLSVGSPANCPGVIAVAGLRHTGTKNGFSSLGPEVAVAAPGGNCVNDEGQACLYPILTTTNTGLSTPVSHANQGSTYTDSFDQVAYGTSFAAPQVSGAVALMLQVRPSLTAPAVAALLKRWARPFPTTGADPLTPVCQAPSEAEQIECYCTSKTCGAGMLDVGAVVLAARDKAVAAIDANPAVPVVGALVTLSGLASMGSPQGSGAYAISTYQWTLLNGGGIVTALQGTAGAVATAVPVAPGAFQVRLTVTDANGQSAYLDEWVHVPGQVVSTVSNGSGGGGGGAVGAAGLWALVAAVLATLAGRQRR